MYVLIYCGYNVTDESQTPKGRVKTLAKVKANTTETISIVLSADAVAEAVAARDTLTKKLGFVPTWRQVVSLTLNQFNKIQRTEAE